MGDPQTLGLEEAVRYGSSAVATRATTIKKLRVPHRVPVALCESLSLLAQR